MNEDKHGCPVCPHPAVGPAITGSPTVNVNGSPALRVGDTGIHSACCGGNMWTATKGAPTVFINGRAAHRMTDGQQHCGGTGRLVEGSDDVNIGDGGGGGGGPGDNGGGGRVTAPTLSLPALASAGSTTAEVRDQADNDRPTVRVRPTWIEIEVVGELGVSVRGAIVSIRFPDGNERTSPVDAAGRLRADDILADGVCEVSLQTPVELAPPDVAPGDLPEADILVAHHRPTIVLLSTAQCHRIAVTRPCVHVVELADAGFETGGQVLRPDAREVVDGAGPGGLRCVAAALERAFADPHARLWIVGHADTVGGELDNVALSVERARNVQLFVAGERSAWAAHCQAHYTVGDFEAAYRFVARTFGWECDPGKVDDDFDDASRRARDWFRQRYAELTGTRLERHVKQNEADWAAIFDMYERALTQATGLSSERLAQRRSRLSFVGPPSVGCGERFPKEAPDADGFASATNRRVDIVVMDEHDVRYLGSPPDPGRVYGAMKLFRRVGAYVPMGDEELVDFVSQLVDDRGNPVPDERYELVLPGGAAIEGRGDFAGFIRVRGVPAGVCRLVYPGLDAREWDAEPIGPRPVPAASPASPVGDDELEDSAGGAPYHHGADDFGDDDGEDGEIPPPEPGYFDDEEIA